MTIYKYRDWNCSWHRSILESNELYLAAPSTLNDPFDCKIFAQFIDLSDKELEKYAEKIIGENNLPKNEKTFIINTIKDNPESYQIEFEETTSKIFDKHLGIISFSTKWDNLLMWSHYGNKHEGFCIGFDAEMLDEKINGSSGLVRYPENKEYPKISPLKDGDFDSFFKTVYIKSIDWRYEDEFRITKIKRPQPFNEEDRKVNFSNEAIKEVILGLNTNEDTEDKILKICALKKIPLFKAKKKQFNFELVKEEIKY